MDKGYVLLRDVVVPAGTVLRRAANQRGGTSCVEAPVEMGPDASAWLVFAVSMVPDAPADLIEEI